MPYTPVPRAQLETYFETQDRPTESQYGELIWSFIHKTDDPNFTGLNDHNPNVAYAAGQCAVNPSNLRVYRCKYPTPAGPPGTPITNTTYWEQLNGDLIVINEPDVSTCLYIKAQVPTGDTPIFVRYTGFTPLGLGYYVHSAIQYAEDLPFVCNSPVGGSWIAAGGLYSQGMTAKALIAQNATVNNALTVGGAASLTDVFLQLLRGKARVVNLSGGASHTLTDYDFCVTRIGTGTANININPLVGTTNQARVLFIQNESGGNLILHNTDPLFGQTLTVPPYKMVMVFTPSGSSYNKKMAAFENTSVF